MGWQRPVASCTPGISGPLVHLMRGLDRISVPQCLKCHIPAWGGALTSSAAPPDTEGHKRDLPMCTEVAGRGWGSSGRRRGVAVAHPAWAPASPFLRLVDDVADLHVEGPVFALQGAVCGFL